MRHDLVNDLPFLDPAGPADHRWNAKTALPVRILLASEWRNRSIRPGVVVRTVIGRVHDNSVIGDAQIIEMVEQFANHHVVPHHGVVVKAMTRKPTLIIGRMSKEVHTGRVVPNKEGLALIDRARHEVKRRKLELSIDSLHALAGQSAGINDIAISKTVDHTTG